MSALKDVKVGVLGLQGGVAEHLAMLSRLPGVQAYAVLRLSEIMNLDALILPGGESTTIGKLLNDFGLMDSLRKRIQDGMPVWGTCAGAIVLAKEIDNDARRHLSVMDIRVSRNAYGSQLDSFTAEEAIDGIGGAPFPLVFVRAPKIESAGADVQVIARHSGTIIACREKNMVATVFHPELSDDGRFHAWFVDKVVRA